MLGMIILIFMIILYLDWYDVISFPLIIIILCISHSMYIFLQGYDAKTEERDRKLEKLLKKRWL